MGWKDYLKNLAPQTYEIVARMRGNGYYGGGAANYGAVFIHVPKTGGTSIGKIMGSRWRPHSTAHDFRRADPRRFESHFKFCFVRNPWDRTLASYKFLRQGGTDTTAGWRHVIEAQRAETIGTAESFEEFVHDRLRGCMERQLFRPQHKYVCDDQTNLMDFTGRYESLAQDFETVAKELGVSSDLPHLNQSQHRPWREYYNPSTYQIVGDVYKADIEIFGY